MGCRNLPPYKPLCHGFSWVTEPSDFTNPPFLAAPSTLSEKKTKNKREYSTWTQTRCLLIQMRRKTVHRWLWLKLTDAANTSAFSLHFHHQNRIINRTLKVNGLLIKGAISQRSLLPREQSTTCGVLRECWWMSMKLNCCLFRWWIF